MRKKIFFLALALTATAALELSSTQPVQACIRQINCGDGVIICCTTIGHCPVCP